MALLSLPSAEELTTFEMGPRGRSRGVSYDLSCFIRHTAVTQSKTAQPIMLYTAHSSVSKQDSTTCHVIYGTQQYL